MWWNAIILMFFMRAMPQFYPRQNYSFHLHSYLSPSRQHWYHPIHQQASPGLPFCLINSHEAKKWEVQDLLLAAARSWQGRDGWRNIEIYPATCPLHSAVFRAPGFRRLSVQRRRCQVFSPILTCTCMVTWPAGWECVSWRSPALQERYNAVHRWPGSSLQHGRRASFF